MTYFVLGCICGGLFTLIFMAVFQATKKEDDR
jgi:hypothetical protein